MGQKTKAGPIFLMENILWYLCNCELFFDFLLSFMFSSCKHNFQQLHFSNSQYTEPVKNTKTFPNVLLKSNIQILYTRIVDR